MASGQGTRKHSFRKMDVQIRHLLTDIILKPQNESQAEVVWDHFLHHYLL